MGKEKTLKNEKTNPAFHLFLYLANFLSLGFVIFGIIGILFALVEKTFEATLGFQYQEALRSAIATLVIATPIHYSILYLLNKKLEKGEISPDSAIRKTITYLAIFIFFAMSVGSLVSLLFGYLNGDLAEVSFFKTLSFLLVSALMLWFYFWEVRREDFSKKNFNKLFSTSLAVALIGIVVGFVIVDSPKVTREKNQDREVIGEMTSAKRRVESFYLNNERLMDKKEFAEIEIKKEVRDKIKYNILSDKKYELCSNFNYSSKEGYIYDYMKDEWRFPAGKYCFNLKVSEDKKEGQIIR